MAGQGKDSLRNVRISEVRYLIDDERKVGPLKVGVLCLPNGSLRWGEVKLPSESEVRDVVGARLEQGAIRINLMTSSAKVAQGPVSDLRIVVEDATFRLCMPGIQMLAGKPKLRGTVKIRWEMAGEGIHPPSAFSSTVAVDEPLDPRRSAMPLLHALAESAEQFSKTLAD